MSFRKTFFILAGLMMTLGTSVAMAAEGGSGKDSYATLGAVLGIAIAAFGGALGQGKTAAAALEGIARNPAAQPKIFIPMIIGLALIESLVLYSFVISLLKG